MERAREASVTLPESDQAWREARNAGETAGLAAVRSTGEGQLTHLGTPRLASSVLTLPHSEHQGCLRR